MYEAEEDKIYYVDPSEDGKRYLFLTVHPDNGSNISVTQQADALVILMNKGDW